MQTSSATEKQIVVSRTAEIRQLAKEAKSFYASAQSERSIVVQRMGFSLENALQCGQRLNRIKEIVGHGNWLTWLTSNWPELSEQTAQRYMRIARENPKASHVRDLKHDSLRKHYLSFVPEKDQPNKHRDVKLERLATFGNLINEYERLKHRHVHGLQRLDFNKVRRESPEIYEFFKWIHGDRPRNPWDEQRHPPRR